MFQKIIIAGNLGGDPELRYTPEGQAVTNFSVATNRRWTGADGQPAEEVTWFRVSVWGKQAEACNQYLSKGRQVLVEGQLSPDKSGNPRIWTDNSNQARASYDLRAYRVQFLGGQQAQGPQGADTSSAQGQQSSQAPVGVVPSDVDEIPF